VGPDSGRVKDVPRNNLVTQDADQGQDQKTKGLSQEGVQFPDKPDEILHQQPPNAFAKR
jgi:hypothetical protein